LIWTDRTGAGAVLPPPHYQVTGGQPETETEPTKKQPEGHTVQSLSPQNPAAPTDEAIRLAETREVDTAHEENDRRDVIQILAAAGFHQARFSEFMITVRGGFQVRTNRSRTHAGEPHYMTVQLMRRHHTPGPNALYERMCRSWTAALMANGAWEVSYDESYPESGLSVTRR